MSDLSPLVGFAFVLLIGAAITYVVRKFRHRKPALPPVHWTKHARERMAQREITESQVMPVLANPGRCNPDPKKCSVRLERDFGGRTLKVWVAQPWPAVQEIVVISVAWCYFAAVKVRVEQIGRIIGRNGGTIKEIEASTGTRIQVGDDGTVDIRANDLDSVAAARRKIEAIAGRPYRTKAP